MKPAMLSALVTAAIALGVPWPQSVSASSGIQHCVGSDGAAIYTDKACPALGGKAVPLSGGLLTRIAAEEARYPESGGPITLGLDDGAPPDSGYVGRRAAQSGCARSKQQLLMDLRGSFALRNVNRLAESYHWVGKSNRQAQQQMLQLERMANLPLRQARLFDGAIASGSMEPGTLDAAGAYFAGAASTLQLTLSRGASLEVVDLDVTRYAGCYFARL